MSAPRTTRRTTESERGAAIAYGELPARTPAAVTVVFDGYCGMCTRSANLLKRLDKTDSLDIVASQAIGVLDRTGVTAAEAEVAAWTVWADPTADAAADGAAAVGPDASGGDAAPIGGGKVGGARAIGLALAVGRGARWPIVAWKLPLLPWVLDRAYGFVADHRRWFPGETPWCERHPDQCVAGEASCTIG